MANLKRKRTILIVLSVVGAVGVGVLLLRPERHARHAILVVFDTLRADRMSVYGYEKDTTPYLVQNRSQFLKFENVKSVAPWTLPSHASIFTGLMPHEHRAQWGRIRLDPEFTTLAEILRDQAFETVSVASNPFLKKAFGLTQGFVNQSIVGGQYRNRDKTGAILDGLPGIIDEALLREDRFFLFLNFMDTHISYNHHLHGHQFGLEDQPPIRNAEEKWRVSAGDRRLTPDEVRNHGAAYDAAVRYLDDVVSEIVRVLRKKNLLEETLVILTSDHGEGLGYHQEMGHSISVWEEQLAIPLLIRFPNARRGGETVSAPVSLVGLAAFILENLGAAWPEKLQMAPSLDGRSDRIVSADYRSYFCDTKRKSNIEMADLYPGLKENVRPLHVVYCGFNKLVVDDRGGIGFFNLEIDPHEQHNLAEERAPALQSCFDQYQDMLSKGQFTAFSETGSDVENDEKQEAIELDALRALGYVH